MRYCRICGHQLPVRAPRGQCPGRCRGVDYLPTPAEIHATCAEIRAGWDVHRWKQQRALQAAKAWSVPVLRSPRIEFEE
jgi:hypothetical protein